MSSVIYEHLKRNDALSRELYRIYFGKNRRSIIARQLFTQRNNLPNATFTDLIEHIHNTLNISSVDYNCDIIYNMNNNKINIKMFFVSLEIYINNYEKDYKIFTEKINYFIHNEFQSYLNTRIVSPSIINLNLTNIIIEHVVSILLVSLSKINIENNKFTDFSQFWFMHSAILYNCNNDIPIIENDNNIVVENSIEDNKYPSIFGGGGISQPTQNNNPIECVLFGVSQPTQNNKPIEGGLPHSWVCVQGTLPHSWVCVQETLPNGSTLFGGKVQPSLVDNGFSKNMQHPIKSKTDLQVQQFAGSQQPFTEGKLLGANYQLNQVNPFKGLNELSNGNPFNDQVEKSPTPFGGSVEKKINPFGSSVEKKINPFGSSDEKKAKEVSGLSEKRPNPFDEILHPKKLKQ